jgi:Chaperone of endosialidase
VGLKKQNESPDSKYLVINGFKRSNGRKYLRLTANDILINGDIKSNDTITASDLLITSSQELKQDVSTLTKEEAYSLLEDLEPVKFAFKNDPSKKKNIGFIAEQVPDIIADDDHKSVRYMEVISALTKVVKELKNEVDELKEKIN